MNEPVRRIAWPVVDRSDPDALVTREWLVTNGLGGYASGTVPGVMTRRYHGMLIAALGAPHGRTVMLSHLAEQLRFEGGRKVELGGRERTVDAADAHGTGWLEEFRLEAGLPVWRYHVDDTVVERRVLLPYRQNTVHVTYELVSGPAAIELALRPSVHFRPQELPVSTPLGGRYQFHACEDDYEIRLSGSDLPPLRMKLIGEEATFTLKGRRIANILYPVEESRGYQARGDLWSPGYFRFTLTPGGRATFIASTESFQAIDALGPDQAAAGERERRERLLAQAVPEAQVGPAAELVLAADQFVATPAGRADDALRARAAGDDIRTVIAGYHWFTDWGRDTMISLEGLTLVTGRETEAGYILRTFGQYVRDGLIPNMFPEGENEGLYHTADATMWFFHALSRYLARTGDSLTLTLLFPTLADIVHHHVQGTRFGIHVDPEDGLLAEGAESYQLTWMDAKVDDWVVTPRRGKPVEINALWYNALRLMAAWKDQLKADGPDYAAMAGRACRSFNERFWYAAGGYLYDVVDGETGDDSRCRPNQIIAMALPHPVLSRDRWEPVLRIVRDRLLTPVGLRSLAPDDPEFKPRYYGDLRTRDAAYHQGTVWAWLAGPFVDAWLKVHPEDLAGARDAIRGFERHLDEACIGSISEVFDAESPYTPRGCIAQAWSVAEVLRIWTGLERRRRQQSDRSADLSRSLANSGTQSG